MYDQQAGNRSQASRDVDECDNHGGQQKVVVPWCTDHNAVGDHHGAADQYESPAAEYNRLEKFIVKDPTRTGRRRDEKRHLLRAVHPAIENNRTGEEEHDH